MEVNANMETFMERVCEKKTLDEIQYEDMFARYNCISRDAQLCLKKKKYSFPASARYYVTQCRI